MMQRNRHRRSMKNQTQERRQTEWLPASLRKQIIGCVSWAAGKVFKFLLVTLVLTITHRHEQKRCTCDYDPGSKTIAACAVMGSEKKKLKDEEINMSATNTMKMDSEIAWFFQNYELDRTGDRINYRVDPLAVLKSRFPKADVRALRELSEELRIVGPWVCKHEPERLAGD